MDVRILKNLKGVPKKSGACFLKQGVKIKISNLVGVVGPKNELFLLFEPNYFRPLFPR